MPVFQRARPAEQEAFSSRVEENFPELCHVHCAEELAFDFMFAPFLCSLWMILGGVVELVFVVPVSFFFDYLVHCHFVYFVSHPITFSNQIIKPKSFQN